MVAAEERGASGIGYNAVISEGEPGYKAWMTAPVWDWSAVLVSEVQSVIDGTWKPENVFFGLKAVSYTHLDVYKRQVHISAACHIYYEACACGETDSYVLACGEEIPQGNAP